MTSVTALLLQAAISLLLLVQGNPNMDPALRQQAIAVAQQAIQVATQHTQRNITSAPVTPIRPVTPVHTTTDGKLYFSTSFFDFGYTIGDKKADRPEEILLTNASSADIDFRIDVDNQPSWLDTSYATDVLTVDAGGTSGIGVLVNLTGLKAGTYKTELTITGNFSDSPKVIPITLRVYSSSKPITIDASWRLESSDDPYQRYILNLSGGTSANPVKWWNLTFSCPSTISEVHAKVTGDVCTGADHTQGSEREEGGDIEVPLSVLTPDTNSYANLEIHIEAIGNDESIMGEIDFVIPVNKG